MATRARAGSNSLPAASFCARRRRSWRAWNRSPRIRATRHGGADDSVWSDEERLLIRLVDELHDSSTISEDLWERLAAVFTAEQTLELIALAGFYHTVSFFANGLGIPLESFGAPVP
jgi:alkylhydroperoxidase family enzyme